jgi:hypothetical protein
MRSLGLFPPEIDSDIQNQGFFPNVLFFRPDEILRPIWIIKNFNTSFIYNPVAPYTSDYLILQRYESLTIEGEVLGEIPSYSSYPDYIDSYYKEPINATGYNITFDNFFEFYFLSLNIRSDFDNVRSRINVTDPSYVIFDYIYTGPEILQFQEKDSNSDIRNVRILSSYYEDDAERNMTFEFDGEGNYTMSVNLSSSAPGAQVADYILYDGVSCSSNANCTINQNLDGLVNVTINVGSYHNLSIKVNPVETVTIAPAYGGGGGSASVTKITSIKVAVPGQVSAKVGERIVLPVTLYNDGGVNFRNLIVKATIAKDGILRNDLIASFDDSVIPELNVGQKKEVSMIMDVNTEDKGLFEITVNVSVGSPVFNEWAKFYVNTLQDEDVEQRIVFTEELIIGNPVCAELVDLLNEARAEKDKGNIIEANKLIEQALNSCKQAIEQEPVRLEGRNKFSTISNSVLISTVLVIVLGLMYYTFRRIRMSSNQI